MEVTRYGGDQLWRRLDMNATNYRCDKLWRQPYEHKATMEIWALGHKHKQQAQNSFTPRLPTNKTLDMTQRWKRYEGYAKPKKSQSIGSRRGVKGTSLQVASAECCKPHYILAPTHLGKPQHSSTPTPKKTITSFGTPTPKIWNICHKYLEPSLPIRKDTDYHTKDTTNTQKQQNKMRIGGD